MPRSRKEIVSGQVALEATEASYNQAILAQEYIEQLQMAMPLEGDLYQRATEVYELARDATNAAYKVKRAMEDLVTRIQEEKEKLANL